MFYISLERTKKKKTTTIPCILSYVQEWETKYNQHLTPNTKLVSLSWKEQRKVSLYFSFTSCTTSARSSSSSPCAGAGGGSRGGLRQWGGSLGNKYLRGECDHIRALLSRSSGSSLHHWRRIPWRWPSEAQASGNQAAHYYHTNV